jgi:hypothetical protein
MTNSAQRIVQNREEENEKKVIDERNGIMDGEKKVMKEGNGIL